MISSWIRTLDGVAGMIGAAHKGSGFYVRKSHFIADPFVVEEFVERQVTNDGKMLLRGPEILAEREYVHVVTAQIAHDAEHFVPRLAQTEHQSGLGRNERPGLFGVREHV